MTTPNQAAPVVPGSDEYNQQMSAVAENVTINSGNAHPQGTGEAPQGELEGLNTGEKLLAGKYKTVEELEAAFNALQAGKTEEATKDEPNGETEGTTEETTEVSEEQVLNATESDAQEVLQSKGLDLSAFSKEYDAEGGLSDESYQKLAEAGIPKEMVDVYIAGREAVVQKTIDNITGVVGGMDNYKSMINWAQNNLTSEEIAAYDRMVVEGDSFAAQLAVEGLHKRYTAANGTNNRHYSGSVSSAQADAFLSTAQVTQAMSDPRYKSDPAYRREVAEKLARSGIF